MVEIHIPKLGIHGRLEPRNLDDDGLPDDLQLLKALQAQEKKQVERLEHSNGQLKLFLAEEDDPDFREAITENLEILEKKRIHLEKIAEKILELTPPQPIAATDGHGYVAAAAETPPIAAEALPAGLDL